VLAKDPSYTVIPGTTKLSRVKENAGAADLVLSDEEVRALEEAVPADAVKGDRYADMSVVNN